MVISMMIDGREIGRPTIILEPWAEELSCSEQDQFRFLAQGAAGNGSLVLEMAPDHAILTCAWSGSIVIVEKNGVVLHTASAAIPSL